MLAGFGRTVFLMSGALRLTLGGRSNCSKNPQFKYISCEFGPLYICRAILESLGESKSLPFTWYKCIF